MPFDLESTDSLRETKSRCPYFKYSQDGTQKVRQDVRQRVKVQSDKLLVRHSDITTFLSARVSGTGELEFGKSKYLIGI